MFTHNNQNHAVDGATALKLENEVDRQIEQDLIKNDLTKSEINLENSETNVPLNENQSQGMDTLSNLDDEKSHITEDLNGLENFGIEEMDEVTPNLFNADTSENSEDTFTSFEKDDEKSEDEDDLEIPAFLRRQKN